MVGLIILGTTMFINIFVTNITIFMTLLGVMGFGAGLILPSLNTLITSSVPQEKRGSVTAIYGSIRFTGVAIGPPTFSYLLNIDRWVMLTVPAVISFFALALCTILLNQALMLEYKN